MAIELAETLAPGDADDTQGTIRRHLRRCPLDIGAIQTIGGIDRLVIRTDYLQTAHSGMAWMNIRTRDHSGWKINRCGSQERNKAEP